MPAAPTPTTAAGGGAPFFPAAPGSAEPGTKPEPTRRQRQRSTPPQPGGQPRARSHSGTNKVNLKDAPCYFHSAHKYGVGNGCTKGADCAFSHGKFMSKAEFKQAERPRAASAARRNGKPGPKSRQGDGSPGPSKQRRVPFHCHKFLKDGACPFDCLLYTSPSPRDLSTSRMPSSA